MVGRPAVIKLTEFLAEDDLEIRVLVYHPGSTETKLFKETLGKERLANPFLSDCPSWWVVIVYG